jgi:hypothetical protein
MDDRCVTKNQITSTGVEFGWNSIKIAWLGR